MTVSRISFFAAAAALTAVPANAANLAGLWLFDNPANLGQATVGSNLIFAAPAPGSFNATLADDQNDILSGVLTTPAANTATRITATHGIAPNGGGLKVNEYSILFDIFSPVASRGEWRSLFQTNPLNGDDGDYFIRDSDAALGVGSLTYSPAMPENSWSRVVVTFDLEVGPSSVRTYLDGNLFHTHTLAANGLDGRFSLDTALHFFTDEDGENFPVNVGALAMWNGALTDAEVRALGAAGAAVPEPGTATLLAGLAGLGMLRRRR